MTDDIEDSVVLRRILVAVDTSSHSLAALEAAAIIARKMEADIHGLFVQDEIWEKLSRLPSIATINELTGETKSLEEKSLERQVEHQKRRLRRHLKTLSRKHNISHRWNTVQGRVEEEILQAAEEADLITIGRRGHSFPEKKQLGSSAKAIIRLADKPILLLKKGLKLGNPITVVYDASEESRRCLHLGLSLARKNDSTLTILVMDNKSGLPGKRDADLEEMIESTQIPVNIQLFQNPTIWSFTHAVNRRESGLLVIPRHQPLLQEKLESMIYMLECPLLLMT